MRLGLFTSQLGTVSETFIRRHVEDLLPGQTAAVARMSAHAMGGRWAAPCPTLFLDRAMARWRVRLARRVGLPDAVFRARTVARFLRRQGVTLALGEYLDQFVEFVPLLDRMGIPYVVQGHGIDVSAALREEGMAERFLAFRSARAVLTRCEFHRQRLIGLGLPADKVHVNPGGVDIPATAPQRGPEAGKRYLVIGRMTAKKGPIILLEAFRRAAADDPELRLDYVGGGELLPAAQQFVAACSLQGCVRLHGAAPESVKQTLLQDCGVFLQHSLTDPETGDEEGLPAGIQEAMAHGMAVISTRHSGIPEAVQENVTGWLVDEGDAGAMAKAILTAAAQPELCRTFGAAGRRRAAKDYSWPAERQRLLDYLGLPSEPPHAGEETA